MFKKHKLDVDAAEKNFKNQMEEMPLEKKDILAMIIAGFIVAIPAMLIVTGVVLATFWFVAGR